MQSYKVYARADTASFRAVLVHQNGPYGRFHIVLCLVSVVLSAGLVHLLGDSATELRSVTKYPIAAFLCGIGFVTTLSAEVLMVGIPCDHLVPTQTTAICPRCMAAQPHEAEAPGTFQQVCSSLSYASFRHEMYY